MIRVENLYKSFDNKLVLKNISVDFEKGKTNLVIGRSGSGKTVLLKSIVGLFEADSGNIYYDQRNFVTMKPKERKNLRKEMGMVFQGGALFDSLTVEQNVGFQLELFTNKTKREIAERVSFCLDRVKINKESFKSFPSEISGGMQKRVSIARAIVLEPCYLFCDEPNSGLDPETSLVIDNLIHEITVDLNMTTIINTHDMNSVMRIGEKVFFIRDGQLQWEGTKDEIMKADDKHLQNFVFANNMYKKYK